MSGYFDALIRSSGMTIGRDKPALTPVVPAALEVGFDGSTTGTEPHAVLPVSTPHEPLVPPDVRDAMARTAPLRKQGRVERHTPEALETAPAPARSATEGAVQSPQRPSVPPMEPPMPDPGHALVHAAMRWVAGGTPLVGSDRAVGPISDIAPGVPGWRHSVSAAHGDGSAIPTKKLRRNEDDGRLESLNGAPATPAPLKVSAGESAEKPVPIRASLVPPAPPAQVAPPVHDEVVEVSIGAIHVRVDAPRAQTVARPAPTPAGHAAGVAPNRPARSALSRRALRRI
jgi:hypothetical protein